jgi:hypothetical protein
LNYGDLRPAEETDLGRRFGFEAKPPACVDASLAGLVKAGFVLFAGVAVGDDGAPEGNPDLAAVRAVCSAVSKPVNFMAGIKGKSFSVPELAAAGVRRVSLATSLYRAAMTAFLDAACEVRDSGQFSFLYRSLTTPELNKLMGI